jgi:NitT/TauT family transport system ATP-binding protein
MTPSSIPPDDVVIRFRGVGKSYRSLGGMVQALDRTDLAVRHTEFVSILGPSGCGKSTLLLIAAGLIPASCGEVWVDGNRVIDPITNAGIAFQRDLLFDWRTILGNVMLQADIRNIDRRQARAKALRLLGNVGLGGFENRYPWELSGGMRQRAALCRALLPDVPLLLLDEPFGALDALTRDQMNLDLQRLWLSESRTALLITHSISEAVFLSDRVFVMSARPGRIVAEVAIKLDRPRTLAMRDASGFSDYQRQLRTLIEGMGVLKETSGDANA